MRGHLQLYHQSQTAARYSVTQICKLVDAGTIASRTIPERKRMRKILANNIEAQKGFAQRAEMPAKLGHVQLAKKLERYRKQIKDR